MSGPYVAKPPLQSEISPKQDVDVPEFPVDGVSRFDDLPIRDQGYAAGASFRGFQFTPPGAPAAEAPQKWRRPRRSDGRRTYVTPHTCVCLTTVSSVDSLPGLSPRACGGVWSSPHGELIPEGAIIVGCEASMSWSGWTIRRGRSCRRFSGRVPCRFKCCPGTSTRAADAYCRCRSPGDRCSVHCCCIPVDSLWTTGGCECSVGVGVRSRMGGLAERMNP